MKNRIMIFVLLLALITLGSGEKTKENIGPGHIDIDLGNGYRALFTLDNSIKEYDIEIFDPNPVEINGNLLSTGYGFFVYQHGKTSEKLVGVQVSVSPKTNFIAMPKIGTDTFSGITQVLTPQKIDGSYGSTLFSYLGDRAKEPSEAISAAFRYYPGARKSGTDLEGCVTVQAETPMRESGITEELSVFQSILNSIHITGPGI